MSIECIKFTPYKSGCLVGFADVKVNRWVSSSKASGLMGFTLKGCRLFKKDSQVWASLPQKETKEDDGTTKYYNFFMLETKEDLEELKEAVRDAINLYREVNTSQVQEEAMPWD